MIEVGIERPQTMEQPPAPSDAGEILAMRDIWKHYGVGDERTTVIAGVSLHVGHGEFVSIIGPSGCGKSTLLRMIAGLLPWDSGTLTVNGRSAPPAGPDRGFVFQDDSLLPWSTIRANVAIGLEIAGVPKREARRRADRMLATVGLGGFEHKYPSELSGGMRQRANLARALLVDPPILLMDEPFGALDAQTRELMQAELLRIWREDRKSVLFVTHQIEEAVYLSDRVLLMSARPGTICQEYPINLTRPRPPEIRYTEEFREIARVMWERLREEVLATFALDQQARGGVAKGGG